jgi:DNA-binding Lrp family transcriptional regulator
MKTLTKKHFKAIASKAIELGYSEELIEICSDSVTFWKSENDESWDEELDNYRSKLENLLSQLSEFFVEAYEYSGNHSKTIIRQATGIDMGEYCDPNSRWHY